MLYESLFFAAKRVINFIRMRRIIKKNNNKSFLETLIIEIETLDTEIFI